jgi:hypothetical protein
VYLALELFNVKGSRRENHRQTGSVTGVSSCLLDPIYVYLFLLLVVFWTYFLPPTTRQILPYTILLFIKPIHFQFGFLIYSINIRLAERDDWLSTNTVPHVPPTLEHPVLGNRKWRREDDERLMFFLISRFGSGKWDFGRDFPADLIWPEIEINKLWSLISTYHHQFPTAFVRFWPLIMDALYFRTRDERGARYDRLIFVLFAREAVHRLSFFIFSPFVLRWIMNGNLPCRKVDKFIFCWKKVSNRFSVLHNLVYARLIGRYTYIDEQKKKTKREKKYFVIARKLQHILLLLLLLLLLQVVLNNTVYVYAMQYTCE